MHALIPMHRPHPLHPFTLLRRSFFSAVRRSSCALRARFSWLREDASPAAGYASACDCVCVRVGAVEGGTASAGRGRAVASASKRLQLEPVCGATHAQRKHARWVLHECVKSCVPAQPAGQSDTQTAAWCTCAACCCCWVQAATTCRGCASPGAFAVVLLVDLGHWGGGRGGAVQHDPDLGVLCVQETAQDSSAGGRTEDSAQPVRQGRKRWAPTELRICAAAATDA
jgi:hypothetical protein